LSYRSNREDAAWCVCVLGGQDGGILLQAFLKENLFAPEKIHGTVQHAERALRLARSGA